MAETPLTPATQAGAPVSGEPEALSSDVLASQEPVEAAAVEAVETETDEAVEAAASEQAPAASPPAAAAAPVAIEPAAAAVSEVAEASEGPAVSEGPEVSEPPAALEPISAAVAAPIETAPIQQAPIEPSVAATLEVPPLPGSGDTAGGEWDLLRSRVGEWLERTDLAGQWQRLQGPLRLLGLLILLVLVLRLYGALVGTLDSLPLVSGLLELVGVLAFGRFCVNRLVRSEERRRLQSEWSQRWRDFRGKA
jgi:hypothetical protein